MSRFLWKVENKKLALLWKWTWTLIKYLWTNCFHFDIKWKHFHPIGKNIQHTSCIPRKTLYKTFFVLIHESLQTFFSVLWSFMPTWQSKVFSYLSISNNAWLIFWIFSAYIFFLILSLVFNSGHKIRRRNSISTQSLTFKIHTTRCIKGLTAALQIE